MERGGSYNFQQVTEIPKDGILFELGRQQNILPILIQKIVYNSLRIWIIHVLSFNTLVITVSM